jgi:hypothetical protein
MRVGFNPYKTYQKSKRRELMESIGEPNQLIQPSAILAIYFDYHLE